MMSKWIIVVGIVIIVVSGVLLMQNRMANADKPVFTQEREVFGVKFYATQGVAENKLQHAMNVMAEYLDNDRDGKVDNESVHQVMIEQGATMVVFEDPEEADRLFDRAIQRLKLKNEDAVQDLYDSEIHIDGAERGVFDATYEEVLHLITHVGYAGAYPEVFGEVAGTTVANIMDHARGGHFEELPKAYPQEAWYTYDDPTADYGTMITEYIYWALTSILGAQDFEGRAEEIEHEWKLNTKAKVMTSDRAIYDLLTDEQYKFPTVLPEGKYSISE